MEKTKIPGKKISRDTTLNATAHRADVFREIEILCGMEHENVMCMKEFYTEKDRVRPLLIAVDGWVVCQVYLITELLTGGELLDAVVERGIYSEADACLCFKQLVSGIAYLHSKSDMIKLASLRIGF